MKPCQDCSKEIPDDYLWFCDECRAKEENKGAPGVVGPTTRK